MRSVTVNGPDGFLWFTDVGNNAIGRMEHRDRCHGIPDSEPERVTGIHHGGVRRQLCFTESNPDEGKIIVLRPQRTLES